MYSFEYLNFFFFLIVFCLISQLTTQDLGKLVLGSANFISPEGHLLNRAKDVLSRVKRQQSITITEDDDQGANDLRQSAICGINGKSKDLILQIDTSPAIDWPWMAAIMQKNGDESFCGGALINRNYILTAAHCFTRQTADQIQVRLGEYDFETPDETKYSQFNVKEVISHPLFDDPNHLNDVALLKLDGVVQYSDYIRPICLPDANMDIKTNETAMVAGWGSTAFAEIGSTVLLEVEVPVRDLEQCKANYGAQIFDQNVCASGYEGNKDSCPGDSGGPLVKQLPNGRWVQIGIVSWGKFCGEPNLPGVYTNVKYFLDWIKKNIVDAQL